MEDIVLNTKFEEFEHAINVMTTTSKLLIRFGMFDTGLYLLATSVLVLLLCKRKQFSILPLNVKITFFVNFITTTYTLVILTMTDVEKFILAKVTKLEVSILICFFLMIHWQFTSHYLQAACLFELSI